MLSQNLPLARPDLPHSPSPSPPPPGGHIRGRFQGRGHPGSPPIPANNLAVGAPPAGAAPLPPPPSRPFNFTRPGSGPPIPRNFFAAQRPNGSAVGSPLRRGHSIAASIPTPGESASSSGDGDREDDSEASSDVEHIQVPGRPLPGIFRLPPPMRDPRGHPQGPWPPQGSSFALSVLSAPRFTPVHRPSSRSSRSASSRTTQTRRARQRIWADVAKQRSKVHHLRETLKRNRIDLQARRGQTDRADNEFMQIIRSSLASSSSTVALPVETVNGRLQVLQEARYAYYGAENAYGDREAELDREEHHLHVLELDLQRCLDDQRGARNDDSSSGSSAGDEEEPPVSNSQPEIHSTHESDTKQDNIDTGQNIPLESDDQVPSPGKHVTVPRDPSHVHDGSGNLATRESESDHVSNNTDKRGEVDPTSASSYILLGIDGDRAEDIHPLYHKLLDAAADREDAREHQTEMDRRHEKILNELEMGLHRERVRANRGNQLSDADLVSLKSSLTGFPPSVEEFKKQFGISIDQDNLDFLRDYKVKVETVRRAMEEAEHEVVRLKALCEEKAAMRKNPPYEEEFTILKGTSMASRLPEGNMALNQQPAQNLSHPIFSTLLSNPMHVLDLKAPMEALKEVMRLPKDSPGVALGRINCMKELGISRLMQKPENKTDYINQWLIHRLRTSPMEVELLFSISTAFLRIVNLRRWQEDVLVHWKTDDAAGSMGRSLARSQTTHDEFFEDDVTDESVGSDRSDGTDSTDGSYSSEADDSGLELLPRARSYDEAPKFHSRRSSAKVEFSTKSSPLL